MELTKIDNQKKNSNCKIKIVIKFEIVVQTDKDKISL